VSLHSRQLTSIFCLACSTLVVELVLTRAYSLVFYYHFSFVAVSMAMLGLAAGAVLLFLRPEWNAPERVQASVAHCAAAFGLSAAVCYVLQLYVPHVFQSGLLGLLATLTFLCLVSVPFVLSGLGIAMLLTQRDAPTARLYAADLCGAAVGCLLVPALLNWTDPSSAVFMAACLAAGAATVMQPLPRYQLLTAILAGAAALSSVSGGVPFPYVKGKPDIRAEYVGWNSFSRVTVAQLGSMPSWMNFYTGPKPESLNVRIDANAGTDIIRSDGNFSQLEYLAYDITSAVYHLRQGARVLILGCGGGKDAATALAFGNTDVTAIEMNDLIVGLLKGRYLDYSGRLAQQARIVWDEARSFLRDDKRQYDIIQMSMIDTTAAVASGAYLLTEHSLYTVEAWTNILQHLSERGIFTVTRNRYKGWPLEVDRSLALAVEGLRGIGVQDPRAHIATVEGNYKETGFPNDPKGLTTILVSRSPWTAQDLAALRSLERFAFKEVDTARGNWEPDRLKLLDPATYARALDDAPLDISAPTDDRPFFFFHIKPGRLLRGDYTALMYHQAVMILPQLLLGVTLLSGFLMGLPLLVRRKVPSLRLSIYFASIGTAFMAVEVGLLQVLSIYLGHPLYSMVVVLFSLLLAGGIGSILSERLRSLGPKLLPLLCFGLVLVAWGYPSLLQVAGVGAAGRIGLSLALIVPLGLLMGMAFPLGLQQLHRLEPDSAAWCWGINGAASVITSVFTLLLALLLGLQAIFWFGLAGYLIAAATYASLART
jgi:SAM-dependent methyltransferase